MARSSVHKRRSSLDFRPPRVSYLRDPGSAAYADGMEARKISVWRSSYRVTDRGREIAVWDSSVWKSGGRFELDGQHFQVRSNAWGNKYTMTDDSGAAIASADRVGRKRWTVEAAGETYHFRRKSMWGNEEELLLGDNAVGSVRKTSFWRGDIAAELPTLTPAMQLFVLGVIISRWEAQAASSGG